MTRKVTIGFEAGSLDVLTSSPGASISAVQKRTGNYSLYFNGGSASTIVLSGNLAEIFIRIGIRYVANAALSPAILLALFDNGGVSHLILGVNTVTQLLELYRGDATHWWATKIATGSTPILFNAWQCIEMRATIDDVTGICQVKVDGFLDINFSGDTREGGVASVCMLEIASQGTNDHWPVMYVDDIAINDTAGVVNNSWIGRGGIYGVVPEGVGTYTDLIASAGNAWDCIEEVPPSDADYVYESTVDKKSTYALTALVPTTGVIACINVIMRAKLDAVGTGNIARLIRSNGTDSQGADVGLDTSPKTIQENIETDPSGGGAWTIARVNALEAGAVVR